jgi:hypothetical protein
MRRREGRQVIYARTATEDDVRAAHQLERAMR